MGRTQELRWGVHLFNQKVKIVIDADAEQLRCSPQTNDRWLAPNVRTTLRCQIGKSWPESVHTLARLARGGILHRPAFPEVAPGRSSILPAVDPKGRP